MSTNLPFTLLHEVNDSCISSAETDTTFVMSCSHFEPYCEGMDQDSLEKIFDQLYQPPDFPALADTLEIYNIKAALWPLVAALNASVRVSLTCSESSEAKELTPRLGIPER